MTGPARYRQAGCQPCDRGCSPGLCGCAGDGCEECRESGGAADTVTPSGWVYCETCLRLGHKPHDGCPRRVEASGGAAGTAAETGRADKWQAGLDGLHTNDCWGGDTPHADCMEIVDAVIDGIENAGYTITAPGQSVRS